MSPDEIINEIRELMTHCDEEEWRRRKPRYERIIRAGERTVKEFPNHYELRFYLALAYDYYEGWYIKGDARKPYFLKAVEHFAAAAEIGEGNEKREAAYRCAIILTEQKLVRDLPRAVALLEFVVEEEENYHPAHYFLAKTYQRDGQLQKAIKAYERAIEAIEHAVNHGEPAVAPAPFHELAKLYLRQGKCQETIDLIRRLEDLNKKEMALLRDMGSPHLKYRLPLLAEDLKLLGDGIFGLGKYKEAKAAWQRARKLDPKVAVTQRLKKVTRRLAEQGDQ